MLKEPFQIDYDFLREVEQFSDARDVHSINNLVQTYKGNIEFLLKNKGKSGVISKGRRQRMKNDIKNSYLKLKCLILSKRMEKYGENITK